MVKSMTIRPQKREKIEVHQTHATNRKSRSWNRRVKKESKPRSHFWTNVGNKLTELQAELDKISYQIGKKLCLSGKNCQSRCRWNILKSICEFPDKWKYSLKEAAGESCSASQLSRWAWGVWPSSLTFSLADNIHVTIENFMDKAGFP